MPNQYVFGTIKGADGERRIVRVKADEAPEMRTDVYYTAETVSEDMTATRTFRIGDCIKRDEDAEGNHYAWYYVTEYSEVIDRTPGCDAEINRLKEENNMLTECILEMSEVVYGDDE